MSFENHNIKEFIMELSKASLYINQGDSKYNIIYEFFCDQLNNSKLSNSNISAKRIMKIWDTLDTSVKDLIKTIQFDFFDDKHSLLFRNQDPFYKINSITYSDFKMYFPSAIGLYISQLEDDMDFDELFNILTIQRLRINKTPLDENKIILLKNLINLKDLSITELDAVSNSMELRNSLSELKELISLDLSKNNLIQKDIFYIFQSFIKLPKLERLNISANSIETIGSLIFRTHFNLPNLLYLNLSVNKIKDDSMTPLSDKLLSLNKLKLLDLHMNQITHYGIKYLVKNLGTLNNLEYFALTDNKIGDKGMKDLVDPFKKLIKMEELYLELLDITDDSIDCLEEFLPFMTELKELYILGGNLFSDKGKERIREIISKTNIKLH
jgi:hypothetical protein